MMLLPKYTWVVRDPTALPTTAHEARRILHRLRDIPETAADLSETAVESDELGLHDAALLPDIVPTIERIYVARERGEHVAIFGDYDVDGVTASAVLSDTLRMIGLHAEVAIPHRVTDGYGLTVSAVEGLVPPATLLITVDNGTSATEAVAVARARGADVIILDHHTIPSGELPDALLVNPARPDHAYPFRSLSAVGVTFKVCERLLTRFHRHDDARWLLDLVALGTLADRVPLRDENRHLVRWGLRVLRETRRPGLRALATMARVSLASCDAESLSFRLIPRLNAAGRLDHAGLAFQLLTTRDSTEAAALANHLEALNDERRRLTDDIAQQIQEDVVRVVPLPAVLSVAGDWPVGIIGILAGRLADDTGRAAVVISTSGDRCTASLRGNGKINVTELLRGIADRLTAFGGHADAAGCSFPHAALSDIQAYFRGVLPFIPSESDGERVLHVDFHLPLSLLSIELVDVLGSLEPHGEDNDRPLFILSDVRVLSTRSMGNDGMHQRFLVHDPTANKEFSVAAFRWQNRPIPRAGTYIDLAAQVGVNTFRGRRQLDLTVRDLRSAEEVGVKAKLSVPHLRVSPSS